jgi:putative endonuclease
MGRCTSASPATLARRVWEHRTGVVEGFTKRYGLKRLVYTERHDEIRLAIQLEKALKHWPRAWKVRLILDRNPEWADLYDQLVRGGRDKKRPVDARIKSDQVRA